TSSTWQIESPIACTILGLSCAVGVPGNLFVIWVILRTIKTQSATTVLILHLAISDLVVLATLPLWIYSLADAWVFGLPFCKFSAYIVYCSMYASVFLIVAMSVERLIAVVYPFRMQRWQQKKGVFHTILLIIWTLSLLLGIPIILVREVDDFDGKLQCTLYNYTSDHQEVACLFLETCMGFLIPFSVLFVCYVCVGKRIRQMTYKTKRKSGMLIASVVVAFFVCWFPHHLFNLISIASVLLKNSHEDMSNRLAEVSETGVYIAGALAFISSSINPLLYAFAARKFRSSMRLTKMTKLFDQLTQSTRDDGMRELSDTARKGSANLQ
uniref:G-protein coupled receptors family 1 profile domain-containing protein n=2 Tax=Latimeria chalumnae TaxID=7897 RepID=H3BCV9_LATCH